MCLIGQGDVGGTTGWPKSEPVAAGPVCRRCELSFEHRVWCIKECSRVAALDHCLVDEKSVVGPVDVGQHAAVLVTRFLVSTQVHRGSGG